MRILLINYFGEPSQKKFLRFYRQLKNNLNLRLKHLTNDIKFLKIINLIDLDKYVYFTFDGLSAVSNERIRRLRTIDFVIIGILLDRIYI